MSKKIINSSGTNVWYTDEKLNSLLNVYMGKDNEIYAAVHNPEDLLNKLNLVAECYRKHNIKEKSSIIPLNINALTSNFGANNHWISLYIKPDFCSQNTLTKLHIKYVDPMGRAMNGNLKTLVADTLKEQLNFKLNQNQQIDGNDTNIEIDEVLSDAALQYTEQIFDTELTGDTDNCGPMLVYALNCEARGEIVIESRNKQESEKLGAYLRNSFAQELDFDTIHRTIKNNDINSFQEESIAEENNNPDITKIELAPCLEQNITSQVTKDGNTANSISPIINYAQGNLAKDNLGFIPQSSINNSRSGITVPPAFAEEKAKVLTQIKQTYENGLRYYQAGDLTLAEQAFAAVMRPILSKSDRKILYVDVEDCKEEALDAMHHLGKIYLASNQYFNNYAKAAGIFQYCAGFAAKYKIDNPDKYLEEAYLVQDKLLESLDKKRNTNVEANKNSKDSNLKLQLDNYKQDIAEYKNDLAYIRDAAAEQINSIRDWPIEEIATRAKVVEEIYNECTNFFVNNSESKEQNPGLIQKMIGSCIKQLGPVPEGCEYSFIGFGSLAGGRMTPWSDLEFAILINEDKEEYKEYFRNLTKLLNIKVVNLGETPLRSLGVEALNNFRTADPKDEWFYDDVLKSGFSFDGPDWHACKLPLGRQGGYKVKKKIKLENGSEQGITINKSDFELILAPKQLAEFQLETKDTINTELAFNDQALIPEQKLQQESWYKSDTHLVQSMRLVSLIEGSQQLIDNYREQLHNNIIEKSEIIKDRAIKKLQEDLESFSLKLGEEEEGKLIDVKKDIFRIGDRIIDALANYYGVLSEEGQPSLNAWKAVDKMQEKGILSPKGAEHLKEALSIATELRLATYCYNQGQNETMSTYQPTVEHLTEAQKKKLLEETFYIQDTNILHHFYYVILRLQDLVQDFCEQGYHNPVPTAHMLKTDRLFDDSNYNKGMVHARFLQYDKALEYMENAAVIQPEDIELLGDLLLIYKKTANIEKALNIAGKILVISKDTNKDTLNHLAIAESYNNLASIYSTKGEYSKGIKYYNKALAIQLIAYKDSPSPHIARSYNNLTSVYRAKGEYEKAIEYCNNALEIWRKVYKDSPHPEIAASYNKLGIVLELKGEYGKAIEYCNNALEIWLKAYKTNPNHPDIARGYNNLGNVYCKKGEYEKGIEYCNKVLQIRLTVYKTSPNHPEIAESYHNLGPAYRAKGEYGKAIEYCNNALEIWLKAYKTNPNHPDIARGYNNLGGAYYSKGEYEEAITSFHKALEIQRIVYKDSPHPEIATSYNNLGGAYYSKGEYEEAITSFHKALEIQRIVYKDSPHPEIATSYNNLGGAYYSKGEYEEAITSFHKALEIQRIVYKDSPHPDITTTYNNLGLAYFNKGEYEEAITYYNEALKIRLKVCDSQ